ncbi:MAG: alanine dehydrogenase [Candidatus Bathyarchaeota archaeon]
MLTKKIQAMQRHIISQKDSGILLINEREVAEILTMEETLDAVKEAFMAKGYGQVQMPSKVYVTFKKYNGDFRVMPSYLENSDAAGVKIVNVHPNNPRIYGKPSVMATIVLIDPRTGAPLAIMGGTYITAMRTGAAGGLATKYLAKENSKILGLVGTGVQARTQLQAISKVLSLEEVRVYDIIGDALNKFIEETKEKYEISVSRCRSVHECIKNADVVSVTTPTTSPIIKNEWIRSGTHINAIGADAPGKQALDPNILKNSKIIVDDLNQAIHSGEINVPFSQGMLREDDIYAELGEVIVGDKAGRVRDDEITVFVSTGLSLQDVSTAITVFRKAKAENMGNWITL